MRWLLIAYSLLVLSLHTHAQASVVPVFIQATVDNSTPYASQLIRYTLRVYTTEAFDDLFYLPPTFDGLGISPHILTEQPFLQVVDGTSYQVYTQVFSLYPRHSGKIVIDSASVRLPQTPFREAYQAQSTPLLLDVKPLPLNSPISFQNAVGLFTANASLDKDLVRVGETLTLTLQIVGDGNLDFIIAPTLPLDENWRIITRPKRSTPQSVTFVWSLIPLVEAASPFPAIEFTYFNPELARFETLLTTALPLEVYQDAPTQHTAPTPIASLRPESSSVILFSRVLWLLPLLFIITVFAVRRLGSHTQTIKPSVWKTRLHSIPENKQALDTLEALLADYIKYNASKHRVSAKQYIAQLEETQRLRVLGLRKALSDIKYAPVFAKQDLQKIVKKFEMLLTEQDVRKKNQ